MTTTEKMQDYIDTDHDTSLAFKALTHLVAKNSMKYRGCLKSARNALLKDMVKKGCYDNMEKTQNFISYNYTQLEILGDSLAPLQVKKRLRSY